MIAVFPSTGTTFDEKEVERFEALTRESETYSGVSHVEAVFRLCIDRVNAGHPRVTEVRLDPEFFRLCLAEALNTNQGRVIDGAAEPRHWYKLATPAGIVRVVENELVVGVRSAVEDIARYVAGDGADAQRMALADGIREGWG